ncbi:hypothetical protein [Paracoccus pacificus]|uniref:SH3 domain-containing protein n=1 Tax=Paracoccus pacificus TaxID=1463598 RepID=A0ABW4RB24_9RHOB
MRFRILIGMVLFASPGWAYVSGEGQSYDGTCNADGVVLKSQAEVTRPVGSGAKAQTPAGPEVIYLGRSCDAYSKAFGEGTWGWANGGFLVTFPGHEIGFPRQEVYCPDGGPQPDMTGCTLP